MKNNTVSTKQIRVTKEVKEFMNYLKHENINSSKVIIEAVKQTHYYKHYNRMIGC